MFDIYECIRNEEIREFFRKQDNLSCRQQIQLVIHSYASMQKKCAQLEELSIQVEGKDKIQIDEMVKLIENCLEQIYHPPESEKVLYVVENMKTTAIEKRNVCDCLISSETTEITFHDEIGKMAEYMEIYSPKQGEVNRELYVYEVIMLPQGGHRIDVEFTMTWIEGRLQIFQIYPDKEWLTQKKTSENTMIDFLRKGMNYKRLPFIEGDRLKIKTPLMSKYMHGTVTLAEYDGCGCWYYFLTPDEDIEKDNNLDGEPLINAIDLSHHVLDSYGNYATFDWVERE